jgi:hypothetical protein
MAAVVNVADVLSPLPPCCLGWICLGYHLSEAPGRVASIVNLLVSSGMVSPTAATPDVVTRVLSRILREQPHWITLSQTPLRTVTRVVHSDPPSHSLLPSTSEWAPYGAPAICTCGKPLLRWRAHSAVFFTLAQGMLQGHVIFLRCFSCNAVYGGDWRWDNVPENSSFPDGFHAPRKVHTTSTHRRWFFATPQVCWETVLLQFVMGNVARGGMSASATFDVYDLLWSSSMTGTMYAWRTHFIAKLTNALMTWSSLRLLEDSNIPFHDFAWHLRPHHESTDFERLVPLLRRAFDHLAALHSCWLFDAVRAVIIDGKWCVQTLICNERGSSLVWHAGLAHGYFRGCDQRPVAGAKFCRRHLDECTIAPEEGDVTAHREVPHSGGISLEYKRNHVWISARDMPVAQIRAYETKLLRRHSTVSRWTFF